MNTVSRILTEIHHKLGPIDDGDLADYIPELARVDPDRFGIALATPDGHRHLVGDTEVAFTIQSVSKAFVYGLVLDAVGTAATEERVDLEPSGDAFNEISLDPVTSKPMNAMINAGAIAITGLVPGDRPEARFAWLRERLSAFAGRALEFDEAVYRSERDTGHRNRAIGHLLRSGGVVDDRIDEDLDLYFRQCSMLVTCGDLAVMGATLAQGGVNPITGERVLSESAVERVLSVMSSSGMYDWSGSWITQVGLPAKSGVGGGIVAVLPGQLALSVYSPRLDAQGNSVRGIAAFRELSKRFNLHLFNTPTFASQVVRRSYRLSESGSSRRWALADRDYLGRAGSSVAVMELHGDLFFAALERVSRELDRAAFARTFVIDCSAVGLVDPHVPELFGELFADLHRRGQRVVVVDPRHCLDRSFDRGDTVVEFAEELDVALEGVEYSLLRAAGFDPAGREVDLAECDLFRELDDEAVDHLRALLEETEFDVDDVLCRAGEPGDAMFVLMSGSLDVVSPSAGRAASRLASISPGACVGEIAVLDGESRSADVIATQASTVLTLTRDALEETERTRPDIYASLMRNILMMNLERVRRVAG